MSTPTPPEITRPSADRKAARLAAIEAEIRQLGETSLAWSLNGDSAHQKQTLTGGGQAPFAIIRRKMARFRLPRGLKTRLLNVFSDQGGAPSSLTTVIVVAHPDDESIGAGARLRHLGEAYVVNVTDGAPRDDACARQRGFESREEYAEARKRELLNALAIAGLPEDRLISYGFVDGEATLRLAELCLKITELFDTLRPDIVLTHAYEGGHTDHDATAFAVHMACGVFQREGLRPPAVLELTSYHARDGRRVVQEFIPHERADRGQRLIYLDHDDRQLKQRIFDCFASQRSVLEGFSTAFERFRPAPRYIFTQPPHEGPLNYERYGHPERGEAWREQARRALRTLRLRRD